MKQLILIFAILVNQLFSADLKIHRLKPCISGLSMLNHLAE